MASNPNYVPPSATLPTDPAMEHAVGDSSSAPEQDAPPPPFAQTNNACTQENSELKFIWNAEHNLMIKKIYDHRAAKLLRQMMSDVVRAIKKELEAYFGNDEGFKRRCLTNAANRVSPGSSKYTGGSVTFMKTKSILSKSLDRKATLTKTFKYTQTLKANKERFVDKRFAAHYITRIGWRSRPNNLSCLMEMTKLAPRP
ncbi:hypothetical protein Ahy_B02g057818 [Arachis hypogaea]|uniref:Uncharacterized protein n=1 Tax=Arachis hypogaea TaxID=3818 RepID=A0A445ACW1_ARAHY|nr:hypothetical protein Ahy_B02g057818 [Arachis hypogaea]